MVIHMVAHQPHPNSLVSRLRDTLLHSFAIALRDNGVARARNFFSTRVVVQEAPAAAVEHRHEANTNRRHDVVVAEGPRAVARGIRPIAGQGDSSPLQGTRVGRSNRDAGLARAGGNNNNNTYG